MTAYEAYWFLHDHPRMFSRNAVLAKDDDHADLIKWTRVKRIRDEMPWLKDKWYKIREFKSGGTEAIHVNLSIFYALVDEKRRVNDDRAKNKLIECWLEFGPVKYVVSEGVLHQQHIHDTDLDCGAATFDIAIVKLARLVKKHYGGYKRKSEAAS